MPASIRSRPVWGRLALAAAAPLAVACKSDSLKPTPVPEPSEVYWELTVDKRAVTMSTTAPYDTVALVATPRNYHGEVLGGLPPVQFVSDDPAVVSVTSSGLLIAQSASDHLVNVVATLTTGNLKHADTVHVRVVDDPAPPTVETFSIHPVPPDSAKWFASTVGPGDRTNSRLFNLLVSVTYVGGGSPPTIPLVLDDGNGEVPAPDVLVSLRSSDTTIASFYSVINNDAPRLVKYALRGVRHGDVDIYASATIFGVTKVDTLHFRIGYPLEQNVDITPIAEGALINYFRQPALLLGTGGFVLWRNESNNPTEVTFDDPTNVHPFNEVTFWPSDAVAFYCFILPFFGGDCTASGSFVAIGADETIFGGTSFNIRTFPVPGVYTYHSAEGRTGQVIVSGD